MRCKLVLFSLPEPVGLPLGQLISAADVLAVAPPNGYVFYVDRVGTLFVVVETEDGRMGLGQLEALGDISGTPVRPLNEKSTKRPRVEPAEPLPGPGV